jgi:hypothetical protein
MSIVDQAKTELAAAGFSDDDTRVMVQILEIFFEQWDSGGAVHAVAPVLQRLIVGKPLSPLTGADDEFEEVADGVFQNKRCGSVFKDPRYHGDKLAYDLDAAEPRAAISLPYWSDKAEVPSPTMTVGSSSE